MTRITLTLLKSFIQGLASTVKIRVVLGEPWCSAWGICAGTTAMEPQQTSSVYSATSSELSKNDELDIEGIFFELSKQLEQEEKQDGVQESTHKETLPR